MAKKIRNLKSKLTGTNPMPEVWEQSSGRYPESELGYFRAYVNSGEGRWHLTSFPQNRDMESAVLIGEFNAVFDAFTRSFKNVDAMSKWCGSHLEHTAPHEWTAFYVGNVGLYQFRMIDRRGDYNLYLHCLDLEASQAIIHPTEPGLKNFT